MFCPKNRGRPVLQYSTALSFSLSLSLYLSYPASLLASSVSILSLQSDLLSSSSLSSSLSPSTSPISSLSSVPKFIETFNEIITEPDKSVSLKCEVTGSPMPTITWKLDGQPLGASNNGAKTATEGGKGGGAVKLTDNSSSNNKNNNNIVNDGRWRIADFVATSPDRRLVSFCNISSITVPEGGLYECSASNNQVTVTYSARVHVKGDPHVKRMTNINAVSSRKLLINCPYSGYPINSIVWSKGPTRLPSNRRQEIFLNGSLVIHDVQKSVDDGTYTCHASNGHKTAAQDVKIIVTAGPMIDPFKFPENIQEGMRARLVCTVIQGDPPFVFQWFKNSELIELPMSNIGIRTDEFSSDLTFNRVSTRHNGNYTCMVSNNVDSDSHTASLNVDVPPYWKVEPVDSSVVLGQNIMIDCLAEGSPSPVITWERGSTVPRSFTTIASGPHFEVYANGSLLIKTVESDDAGLYLCQANNAIGPGLSKVVTLTVHTHPQFLTKFRSETVRLSDDIELSCDVRGDSPMTITWFKDKQPLEKDSRFTVKNETWPKRMLSTLKIESARRRDSALFTCLASNSYGKDETNIRLIVQEPPESPKDLRVLEQRSREVKLAWTQAFNGNSEINRFWITCHPKDYSSGEFSSFGHLNMSVDNLSIEEGPTYIVRDLRPATTYVCSVKSENDVGLSKPSKTIEFTTEEQAPEGPPLNLKAKAIDSRSAKVTWNAPDRKLWNGKLKGYYIGYKVSGSDEQYLYKTLEISADERYNEVVLTSLKPFTTYDIIVQVYNSMGTGPRSDPISVTTLEEAHPQFLTKFRSETVRLSDDIELSCDVRGDSPMTITWFKDKQPLEKDSRFTVKNETWPKRMLSTLKIESARRRDSALFTCLASNSYGKDETNIRLIVQEPPESPKDLRVLEQRSREVKLAWTQAFNGNSEINRFWITCHPKDYSSGEFSSFGHLNMSVDNLSIEEGPTYIVRDLRPATTYVCSVKSENDVGLSKPSKTIEFTTEEQGSIDKSLKIKVISTSHTSAQISFSREASKTKDVLKDYELNYRVVGWSVHDWQIKRIFRVSEGNNMVTLDNLLCGKLYKLYLTDLQTGSKSETITFQTQGSAPVAPKKEDIIKVVNNSSIYIDPSAWEQTSGCPITKMIIEYRSASHQTWKMVSTPSLPNENEPIQIHNLIPKTTYSVRITAYTKGSPSTMAEYDVRLGVDDKELFLFGSGFLVDTTTAVSFLSSLVILITGCFAIVCLIVYKRNSSVAGKYARSGHYRRQSSTSCAPSSNEGDDKRAPIRTDTTTSDIIKKNQSLSSLQSSKEGSAASKKGPAPKVLRGNSAIGTGNSGSGGGGGGGSVVGGGAKVDHSGGKLVVNPPRGPPCPPKSPIRGRLPQVRIPTKQLEEIEKDLANNDYDEITPYATFRLTGDDDGLTDEEFKTFSVHIGEPGYIYKNVDSAPTTSRDYKTCGSSKGISNNTNRDSYLFSSAMATQSVTSGSSAQDELLYAYEYGRRYQLSHHPGPIYYDEDDPEYGKSQTSEMDTPTDPGIRQFTKSPPKPNEKRTAACLTPGAHGSSDSTEEGASDSCSSSGDSSCVTPINPSRLINVIPYHAAATATASHREPRRPSYSQLNSGTDKSDKIATSDEQASHEIGLTSDEDELPSNRVKSKAMQTSAPALPRHRNLGRPPRTRNKRPIRTKSRSDEIEC